jgi:hypothetical protein
MAIRVALIGTGNCGSLALKQLVNDARFDLTGVWVSSDVKVGKDAGELAGLDVTTGIAATNDLDAIIASKPDCIVYCAMGDTRLAEAMADVRCILAAGIDVVGSGLGVLQYPWQVIPDKYIERVEEAAQEGNSSVFMTGVDPDSRRISCLSRWPVRARASSRCERWRSPTTRPTTGRR